MNPRDIDRIQADRDFGTVPWSRAWQEQWERLIDWPANLDAEPTLAEQSKNAASAADGDEFRGSIDADRAGE